MNKKIFLFLLFPILFLLTSCATILTTKNDPVIIPEFLEIQFGLATQKEIAKKYRLYPDKSVQDYIQNLGDKLVSASDRKDLNYKFYVVRSREVNAFALPGGFIYVTTGLIKNLDNEAELCAVLGHEIGHVVKKHSVKALQRTIIAEFGIDLLDKLINGEKKDNEKLPVKIISSIGIKFLFLKNSRENEFEADEYGTLLLSRLNYNPYAMIDVQKILLKLRKRKPTYLEQLLSTHPVSEERIKHAEEYIKKYNLKGERINSEKFNYVKRMIK